MPSEAMLRFWPDQLERMPTAHPMAYQNMYRLPRPSTTATGSLVARPRTRDVIGSAYPCDDDQIIIGFESGLGSPSNRQSCSDGDGR